MLNLWGLYSITYNFIRRYSLKLIELSTRNIRLRRPRASSAILLTKLRLIVKRSLKLLRRNPKIIGFLCRAPLSTNLITNQLTIWKEQSILIKRPTRSPWWITRKTWRYPREWSKIQNNPTLCPLNSTIQWALKMKSRSKPGISISLRICSMTKRLNRSSWLSMTVSSSLRRSSTV